MLQHAADHIEQPQQQQADLDKPNKQNEHSLHSNDPLFYYDPTNTALLLPPFLEDQDQEQQQQAPPPPPKPAAAFAFAAADGEVNGDTAQYYLPSISTSNDQPMMPYKMAFPKHFIPANSANHHSHPHHHHPYYPFYPPYIPSHQSIMPPYAFPHQSSSVYTDIPGFGMVGSHGDGEDGNDFETSTFSFQPVYNKSPFIVEYPTGGEDGNEEFSFSNGKMHVNPSEVITPELYQSLKKSTIHSIHPFHLQSSSAASFNQSSSQQFKRRSTAIPSQYHRESPVTTDRPSNSNAPVVIGPDGQVYQKPPYSYAALISRALRECGTGKLTLSGIYDWIKAKFPYYRTAEAAWQCFKKIPRPANEPGKGGFWMLDEEYIRQQALAKQQTMQLNMALNEDLLNGNDQDDDNTDHSQSGNHQHRRRRTRRLDEHAVGGRKRGRKSLTIHQHDTPMPSPAVLAGAQDLLAASGLPELSRAASANQHVFSDNATDLFGSFLDGRGADSLQGSPSKYGLTKK